MDKQTIHALHQATGGAQTPEGKIRFIDACTLA